MTQEVTVAAKEKVMSTENQDELKTTDVDTNTGNEMTLEIEVVDDTPAADRGKAPIGEVETPSDQELDNYAVDVQKRIKKLSRGYHDERRAKEAAAREREEAVVIAKQLYEQNKALQKQLTEGSKQLVDTSMSAADAAIEAAKRKFKEAYDAGDAEAIATAQEEIAAARYKKEYALTLKPLQFEETTVYNQPQETKVPVPDSRALDWQTENEWFGQDEEMTSFALGLHQKLVKSGVNPNTEEYYERVDARMREIFPDQFRSETKPDSAPAPRAKSDSVVAPATRSTAPKRITLSATQVALAKRLGLTNEQYAHELMKLKG